MWLQVFIPTKQEHTWFGSVDLLDQFDTPDLNHFILFPHNIIHLLSSQYLF